MSVSGWLLILDSRSSILDLFFSPPNKFRPEIPFTPRHPDVRRYKSELRLL